MKKFAKTPRQWFESQFPDATNDAQFSRAKLAGKATFLLGRAEHSTANPIGIKTQGINEQFPDFHNITIDRTVSCEKIDNPSYVG